MQTVTVERVVGAPVEDVFGWLADARNYPKAWLVLRHRQVETGQDAPYGTGAVRTLTWVFGWFRERTTAYDAPRSFDYLVERSFPPVDHEGGRLTFTAVDGGTKVTWTTTVEMKVPVIADTVTRVLGRPMVSYGFGRILAAADAALRPGAVAR